MCSSGGGRFAPTTRGRCRGTCSSGLRTRQSCARQAPVSVRGCDSSSSRIRRCAGRSRSQLPRRSSPRRVVLAREADYHERYQQQDKLQITAGSEIEWPAPYWYVDAGAAAMALMFAAIDEGLATAIFGVTDVPALKRSLGVPDDVHFVVVVTMGYPADDDTFPERAKSAFKQRRKPRSEVVHWERW